MSETFCNLHTQLVYNLQYLKQNTVTFNATLSSYNDDIFSTEDKNFSSLDYDSTICKIHQQLPQKRSSKSYTKLQLVISPGIITLNRIYSHCLYNHSLALVDVLSHLSVLRPAPCFNHCDISNTCTTTSLLLLLLEPFQYRIDVFKCFIYFISHFCT